MARLYCQKSTIQTEWLRFLNQATSIQIERSQNSPLHVECHSYRRSFQINRHTYKSSSLYSKRVACCDNFCNRRYGELIDRTSNKFLKCSVRYSFCIVTEVVKSIAQSETLTVLESVRPASLTLNERLTLEHMLKICQRGQSINKQSGV